MVLDARNPELFFHAAPPLVLIVMFDNHVGFKELCVNALGTTKDDDPSQKEDVAKKNSAQQ